MIRHARALLAIAVVFAACAQLSCKLNDYCLACEKGDGGPGDGGPGSDGSAGDGGNCVPSGPEICDGKDNDCNGLIDDNIPQVGTPCGTGMGACAGAVYQCTPTTPGDPTTDTLSCSKQPAQETCDNIDNNCNGIVDDGDPGGGARCGNGTGTCVQGVEHCVNGSIQCVGGTLPTMEVCDGRDNDCNGVIDNGLTNLGSCGAPEPGCASPPCGVCQLGTLSCVGGTTVCTGAVNPGFETCNNMDDDCDGSIDEDFNKQTDPQNCGACGNVCGAGLPSNGHATWGCSAGGCVITSCLAGYHDNNTDPADGCEFGPCFTSGAEVCDGVDNDCDGTIDEAGAIGNPPAICATQGECAGTKAVCPCQDKPDSMGCANPGGWTCTYPSTVSTDGSGNIVAETLCDGKDNDCNGVIDDHQPQMSHPDGTALTPVACNDGGIGACEGTGQYVCGDQVTPPQDPNGPAQCKITTPGGTSSPETCNGKDDDCDGAVDEGNASGSLGGQTWVSIGGGHQMMEYEASQPDATSTDQGVGGSRTTNTLTIVGGTGGASESGTTATITTSVAHGFSAGQVVTVSGVGVAGYNGTRTITAVPSPTTFQVTLGATGLAASGGGTASTPCTFTIAATGASESGSTATFTTTSAHGITAGKVVTISGVGVSGYDGTYVVTGVPSTTKLTVTLGTTGLGGSGGGTVATECGSTCSRSGVLPRTNLTYLQALAACQAVGATLCSESRWHMACSAVSSSSYPITVDGTGTLIEAEDYYRTSYATGGDGTTRSWVEDETPGFFGTSAMATSPDSGDAESSTNAATRSPHLDYLINVTTTGTTNYHVCVHMFSPKSASNTVWLGSNAGSPGGIITTAVATSGNGAWQWRQSTQIAWPAGQRYLSVYMDEDGTKVDALYLVAGNCPNNITDNNGPGGQWSYASNPNTYAAGTCNGQDYSAANDDILPAGTAGQCYASFGGTGPHDLSGNVKEWVFAHQPGENPIRGGSSNDTSIGIDCPLDFTLADDTFFFPDVGFRCCR